MAFTSAAKEPARSAMTQLDARLSAEDRLAEIHRRDMVTAAPADFKPEPVARKIRLKLVLEKPAIRVGESPRFRLEMTNVGREPIEYHENRSSVFVKGGGLLDSPTMIFYLIDSKNNKKELMPSSVPPPPTAGRSSRRQFTPPTACRKRRRTNGSRIPTRWAKPTRPSRLS